MILDYERLAVTSFEALQRPDCAVQFEMGGDGA